MLQTNDNGNKAIRTMLMILGATLLLTACHDGTVAGSQAVPATAGHDAQVQRGQYMVTVGGCNDCHTPLKMTDHGPEPDMTRMLSGHPAGVPVLPVPALPQSGSWMWAGSATNTAFVGPWGVTFAMNLTPEQNTGLGIWTEDMFVRAMRTGRHMGTSRPINPPMPWQAIGKMTDDDLKAIYAYLRSIPPVTNQIPQYLEPSEIAK